MSVSADYLAYVVDQLAGFSSLTSRRMFGGVGLYADGVFFGLIDDDTLYFKVGDANRADYTARGCKAFQPTPGEISMSYFEVPADVLEDADALRAWATTAVAVARTKAARPRKQSRTRR